MNVTWASWREISTKLLQSPESATWSVYPWRVTTSNQCAYQQKQTTRAGSKQKFTVCHKGVHCCISEGQHNQLWKHILSSLWLWWQLIGFIAHALVNTGGWKNFYLIIWMLTLPTRDFLNLLKHCLVKAPSNHTLKKLNFDNEESPMYQPLWVQMPHALRALLWINRTNNPNQEAWLKITRNYFSGSGINLHPFIEINWMFFHMRLWMAKDAGEITMMHALSTELVWSFSLCIPCLLCQKDTESQSQSIYQMYYHSPNCWCGVSYPQLHSW